MNKIIYIITLFFGVFVFSQSVTGIVETEEGLPLKNIMVINLGTNEKSYTNEMGKFTISAKPKDEIRLVKKDYDRLKYVIKQEDYENMLYFKVKKSEILIEEVVISKIKLTGNLAVDSKSLDKEDVNAKIQKSLGTEAIEKQVRNLSGSAGISFNMASLFTGKKKREQKQRLEKYEQLQSNAVWIKERVDSEYFVRKGIPEVRIAEFIQFSLTEKPEVKAYIKANNIAMVMTAIDMLIPVYIKKIGKKTTKVKFFSEKNLTLHS